MKAGSAGYLHNFFGTVREMFLDLGVCELEYLQTVCGCRLCCLGFREVVNDLLVWESLLNVLVVEVHDGVTIREGLSFDTVVKDDFLFATRVHTLDLAIVADYLVDDLHVGWLLSVVLLGELETEIFLLFFPVVSLSLDTFFFLVGCLVLLFLFALIFLILVVLVLSFLLLTLKALGFIVNFFLFLLIFVVILFGFCGSSGISLPVGVVVTLVERVSIIVLRLLTIARRLPQGSSRRAAWLSLLL